jgi:hypothetical protein
MASAWYRCHLPKALKRPVVVQAEVVTIRSTSNLLQQFDYNCPKLIIFSLKTLQQCSRTLDAL